MRQSHVDGQILGLLPTIGSGMHKTRWLNCIVLVFVMRSQALPPASNEKSQRRRACRLLKSDSRSTPMLLLRRKPHKATRNAVYIGRSDYSTPNQVPGHRNYSEDPCPTRRNLFFATDYSMKKNAYVTRYVTLSQPTTSPAPGKMAGCMPLPWQGRAVHGRPRQTYCISSTTAHT